MSARKKNTTTRPAEKPAETTPQLATAEPVLRTDSEKALWTALGNFPGFTAAELAGAAGIDASTARRILSGWATTGAARREPDQDNPRAAEHWSPAAPATATPTPSADDTADTADPSPEPTTPQPDNDASASDDASAATNSDATTTDATPTDPQAPPQQPPAAPTGSETSAPATDAPTGEPDAAATPKKTADRLAPGALRGEVEDYLRDAPDKEFTPHEIGKTLGRSSGAVHNALVKLTDLGTARQTCTRPKKFALALG
ncbi:hypothetical protein [Nocardia africana]|uniref:MarR family n=1 Tax=Nocardia africana TaxID=134964 RepID=A0ABW6NH55_9NOCA